MGLSNSTPKPPEDTERDDDGHKKGDNLNLEANPFIEIVVIYEQPQGTGLHLCLTLDPRQPTTALKAHLTRLTGVPVEHVCLIYKLKELDDELPLHDQDVEPHDIIVFRDKRLSYSFP